MRWERIIIHHSATDDGDLPNIQAIRKYHKEVKGWADIGYHWVLERITDDVEILVGITLDTIGTHCEGKNTGSIGICCVGNYNYTELPEDVFNRLVTLCKSLCYTYEIAPSEIHGHRDFKNTDCPGKNFPIGRLVEEVTKRFISH